MVRFIALCLFVSLESVLTGCGVGSEVKQDPIFQPGQDVYSAAIAGDVDAVAKYMNQGGWDPSEANYDGLLPLCAAAQGGNVEIIQLMVNDGADVNAKDLTGKTPLQYAKDAGNQEAANLLQELGATN
jgi:ankyrin repeat protein